MERICEERRSYRRRKSSSKRYVVSEFRIRWAGFGPEEDTWEPQRHIPPQIVADFRHRCVLCAAMCMLGAAARLRAPSCDDRSL